MKCYDLLPALELLKFQNKKFKHFNLKLRIHTNTQRQTLTIIFNLFLVYFYT